MNVHAQLHVLKANAGLDDDTYRDFLERETGKRSSKFLTPAERAKVVTAMQRLLPETDPDAQKGERATGKFARKLQALWIAGYNLGVIANNSDQAMIAFVKRQTGLDHHRFLVDATDADKAIDALKLWIRRATQNYELFTRDRNCSPLLNDYRFQICVHIWSELVKLDKAPAGTLTAYLFSLSGKDDPTGLLSSEWINAMNKLGKIYRTVK